MNHGRKDTAMALQNFIAGNYVTFGSYPQTADGTDRTPVEWLVLEVRNGKALLLSKYGLDVQPYHKRREDVTWEDCSLREWLNDDFYNDAFTAEEKKKILTAHVRNDRSQGYLRWSHDGGNDTWDKVFLLSYGEANAYFGVVQFICNEEAKMKPTEYAIEYGAILRYDSDGETEGTSDWWLRSPGEQSEYAAIIEDGGNLHSYYVDDGYDEDGEYCENGNCVRPALWITISASADSQASGNSRLQGQSVQAINTPEDFLGVLFGQMFGADDSNVETFVGYEDASDKDIEVEPYQYSDEGYVTFGCYPQTESGTDCTPIEWQVLAREGNKVLLLSRHGLDSQPYDDTRRYDFENSTIAGVTWEDCSLRKWLNGTFLRRAFTLAEQKSILTTYASNDDNQGYSEWNTDGGNDTVDKVFLLSYAEANRYFEVAEGEERNKKASIRPTKFAIAQGASTVKEDELGIPWWLRSEDKESTDEVMLSDWWLRSPGDKQYRAAVTGAGGTLSCTYVLTEGLCVRPALWVDESSVKDAEQRKENTERKEKNSPRKTRVNAQTTRRQRAIRTWMDKYGEHVEFNPRIDFNGKLFAFSGIDSHANEKNNPIVQAVMAKGGQYRSKVSGLTNYLVVDPEGAGESKIVAAIEQRQKGKKVKIVLLEDLENALGSANIASDKEEDLRGGSVQRQESILTPEQAEALGEIQKSLRDLEKNLSDGEDALEKYSNHLKLKERREKEDAEEKARAKAEAQARGRSEKDAVDMYIILTNEKKLGHLQRSDEDFYRTYEGDFNALSEPEVLQLRKNILDEMKNESSCNSYAESFRQRTVEERFKVATLNLNNVSDEPDFGKKAKWAIENSVEWFENGEHEEVKRLMDADLAETRGLLDEQYDGLDSGWKKFATAKDSLRIVIKNKTAENSRIEVPSTLCKMLVDTNLVEVKLVTGGFFSLSAAVIDCMPWYWNVTVREIWEAALCNPVDDEREGATDGTRVANQAVNVIRARYPIAGETTKESTNGSANRDVNNGTKQNNSAKKEGCYIATAVYGSYDAPQVMTLRHFRDETLQQSTLGRWFIRIYYRLSPSVADKLKDATRINKLVRRILDRFVKALNEKEEARQLERTNL